MKQIWYAVSLLTCSLLATHTASAETSPAPEALLQQMSAASQSLNYELSFISITKQGIDSYRYRHAKKQASQFGDLLLMDGPRREVVQRGNDISYFETGLQPFTLSGDHIVDSLPELAFSDITHLAKYYDFISVGRARAVDRSCEVIRVVSRDGSRFSYIIWIDDQDKLPLRVDLLDRDGETLEQFRVISLTVDPAVEEAFNGIEKANLPPLLSIPESSKTQFTWDPKWLPDGVKEVSRSKRQLPNLPVNIESRLYSDGLFSFSINVNTSSTANAAADQIIRQGRRTVQTEVRNGNEITVVGELPPSTAKRISDSIVFSGQ
ncbi:sigma-E factor regulatory protein RseB [Rouxiella chamberiensis]|uniref:Sigma-E factor regulatory protein RseB n=1 Tax=Rouxiella chamberiensis TaxID=1513468 RepID=A0ABY7HLU1_9GAMM|nr:sigma-E factor regulatory protein RseB [Rouxiella chamberiensis]WAT00017.1 sigma-E factor regulatory protein RseB [Rouxiella chamberiensis]